MAWSKEFLRDVQGYRGDISYNQRNASGPACLHSAYSTLNAHHHHFRLQALPLRERTRELVDEFALKLALKPTVQRIVRHTNRSDGASILLFHVEIDGSIFVDLDVVVEATEICADEFKLDFAFRLYAGVFGGAGLREAEDGVRAESEEGEGGEELHNYLWRADVWG